MKITMIGLGRTGIEIAKAISKQSKYKIVSVLCSSESEKLGVDLGDLLGSEKTGVTVSSIENLEEVLKKSKPEVVIDFSNSKAALNSAEVVSKMKINMVIGTTGFSEIETRKLEKLSEVHNNGIVYAPNITLGVNVSMLLANIAASILNNYEFHINEIHHKYKKDSPSGTALKIAKEIEKGLQASGNDKAEEVSISSLRAGGIIGKHEILIIGENDKIEISHEAINRQAFAEGAIKATNFIYKKSGYYEMNDVLNLSKVFNDYMDGQYKKAIF